MFAAGETSRGIASFHFFDYLQFSITLHLNPAFQNNKLDTFAKLYQGQDLYKSVKRGDFDIQPSHDPTFSEQNLKKINGLFSFNKT